MSQCFLWCKNHLLPKINWYTFDFCNNVPQSRIVPIIPGSFSLFSFTKRKSRKSPYIKSGRQKRKGKYKTEFWGSKFYHSRGTLNDSSFFTLIKIRRNVKAGHAIIQYYKGLEDIIQAQSLLRQMRKWHYGGEIVFKGHIHTFSWILPETYEISYSCYMQDSWNRKRF